MAHLAVAAPQLYNFVVSSTFTADRGETPSHPPKVRMLEPSTVAVWPYAPAGGCPGTLTDAQVPTPSRSNVESVDRF